MKFLLNLFVAFGCAAFAASAQELFPIQQVYPLLMIVFSPAAPIIPCNAPAGTVVATASTTGGDGNPITLGITGDTTDFALSATTAPANVIVASGGITSATGKCPITTPVTEIVTINASQP